MYRYCDCFQALKYCDVECNCVDCHNDKNHEGIRQDAVKLTKEKNESAFKVKICKDVRDDCIADMKLYYVD